MDQIEVVESGYVDRSDSAFPTLVRLDDGEIICGFSVGDGPDVSGCTHQARSSDGGRTWTQKEVILPTTENPRTTNHLRLSSTPGGTVLAYGAREYPPDGEDERKHRPNEPVFCTSVDGARTWSAPQVISHALDAPLEITNPIVVVSDGRWLAPGATVRCLDRYGERVVLFESDDEGLTWPRTYTIFEDPSKEIGYLEQKVIELEPGRLLAVCWTMCYADGVDLEDHFCLSRDGGRTWSRPHSTGLRGQTMTPIWLGGDRLLVLYNRRYGDQGVRMCLVRLAETEWQLDFEGTMWDAGASRQRPRDADSVAELDLFQFGLPSALRLDQETFLAVHWCKEDGVFGIRWTRLRLAL